MTYGRTEAGEAYLHLSRAETLAFEKGEAVKKITACAKGEFHIVVKMTKAKKNRFVTASERIAAYGPVRV